MTGSILHSPLSIFRFALGRRERESHCRNLHNSGIEERSNRVNEPQSRSSAEDARARARACFGRITIGNQTENVERTWTTRRFGNVRPIETIPLSRRAISSSLVRTRFIWRALIAQNRNKNLLLGIKQKRCIILMLQSGASRLDTIFSPFRFSRMIISTSTLLISM